MVLAPFSCGSSTGGAGKASSRETVRAGSPGALARRRGAAVTGDHEVKQTGHYREGGSRRPREASEASGQGSRAPESAMVACQPRSPSLNSPRPAARGLCHPRPLPRARHRRPWSQRIMIRLSLPQLSLRNLRSLLSDFHMLKFSGVTFLISLSKVL